VANFNAPDQLVVGGKRPQLEALARALEAQSHQARILAVPAAFHTPLMAGASRLLEQQMRAAELHPLRVPMISTVTNVLVRDVTEIRRNLAAQLTTPVRYAQLIARLAAEQPTVFVEVGPQQTLTRLTRRILDAGVSAIACDNPKRAGLEPLLCVQALLECLGVHPANAVDRPKSQPGVNRLAQSIASSANSITSNESSATTTMNDNIPHFDATERRRAKMRGGAGGQSAAASNGARHSAPAAKPPATAPAANRAAPPPRPAPDKAAPAVAASPTPAKSPAPARASAVSAPPLPAAPRIAPAVATPAAVEPAYGTMARNGNGVHNGDGVHGGTGRNGDAAHNRGTNGDHTRNGDAQRHAAVPSQAALPAGQRASIAPAELESFLINFVVEQTGYPPEVVELDADLEADLGVDSIKKAQLFGELQEYFDIGTTGGSLSLDDFPTLRHVLNFLQSTAGQASPAAVPSTMRSAPTAEPTATSMPPAHAAAEPDVNGAPASARATAAPGPAELESFLINFVVEQTGYPPEVVELDADLEADLGVDSIKKAQLFGELQEYFDIGTSTGNVSLDDFPTLRHVLNFLQQAGSPTPAAPTLAGPVAAAPVEVPSPVAATAEPVSPPTVAPAGKSTANAAELESFLINFVVEQTGYPPEVVELDADLEADLGVDSIKKAQLFGELQEYFDIGTTGGSLSLDDFPTLRHVLTFLVNASAGSSAPEGVQQVSATVEPALAVAVAHHPAPAPVATTAASNAVELESFLINFVVEQTGYPPEVVELDADLEADLGVDSIKKAQLFGELQEYFDIGVTGGNLSLDDFPTLRHVLDFLLGANVASGTSAGATATMETPVAGQHSSSPLAETNGHAPGGCAAAITPERFEGTPYELGWVRGRRFKNEIRRVLRTYAERVNGQLDERSGYELLSADELDELQGMADSVEVPLGNLVAHHSELSRELASWLGEPSVHGALSGTKTRPSTMREAALPELPSTGITSRFVLEMRDAPLAGDIPAEPAWTGAAIVLGANAQADALRSRLRDSGVEVHDLPITDEIDATLAALEAICLAGPTPHLFITTSCDGLFGDVNDEQSWSERRHEAMTLPFFVCQKWLGLASAGKWLDRATLVAVTALGGDFGFLRGAEVPTGGAVAGLLKAITIEYAIMQDLRNLQVKVIDAPLDAATDQLVDHIFRELASGNLDYEVAFVGDRRQVPFAVEDAVHGSRSSDIRSGAVWVVTGGARGITAACALELGRRFGLKLHLLGTTALPEIDPAWRDLEGERLQQLKASVMIAARKDGRPAAQAWRQVEKDLEIDRSLRAFAAAGVEVTYHACDVSDRAAVERTLARIRAIDGPIEGVLHGAGIDRSCRFDRKQRDVVLATIGAKVDGAAHLMALTRRDPIRHFIGFGSISGRLGSFGQADYCLASDMHCKLIGAYRRERPWIKAVGFHWHPWDEVGMAARPETKNVLEGKSDLHLMPLAEGIAHLVRELAAGAPAPEVLITERRHWQRFAAGIGKLAERTPGAKSSPVVAPPAAKVVANAPPNHAASDVEAAADADHSVELHTHRCQLRTLVAPLSPNSPKLPALDGPAWILGENAAALALAARLSALGCGVRHIRVGDVDATLAEVDRLWAEEPAKHLFLMTGRDEVAGDLLDADVMRRRRDDGILLPFLVAQRWYKLLVARPELGIGTLAAAVSLGGDFGFGASARVPDGGALAGLLKAVHIEDSRRDTSRVRAKVIDAPANESAATFVDALLNELAASEPEVEVCWSHGTRRVVRPLPAAAVSLPKASVPRGGTWVVTGGARGITAIAARELARRYGWKLHLVGKSPAPQADAAWRHYGEAEMKSLKTSVARGAVAEGRSPSEAWDRVMKDVEIFNNLHSFAEAGVQATYHACDIGDRAALAAVLDAVRRQDGPITGILHGAGVIDPSRFEGKRRQIVSSLVGAKFDGTLNLMALTARDPLAFFIGFGSISGRFGGNGLTDYAAGNDALAKLIDWFAGTRRDCRSACIHWESWEGSGMATLPRYAWGPKSVMNMKYMLPEEGVRRLEQELAAGLPDSEVLYTFGDFYPMFYPHEQRPLGPFVPGQLTAAKPAAASESQVTEPPLLLNMRRDAEGLTADVPLDPIADSFLAQHRLRDKALLPVVVGLEALAEAAALASGKRTIAFQNVQMLDGLLFHTERPVTAAARSAPEVNGTLACRLTCDFRNRLGGLIQKDRPYLSANVIVADEVPAWAANFTAQPGAWTEFAYPEGAAVYHGPVFRGVTATSFDRQGGFGRIVSLPLADLTGTVRAARWTIPSCVLDAAFYACGIHLWTHGQGAVSLPRAIERLRLGRTPRAGETCLVHFTCRDIATDAACYDFTVIGEDRAVIVQAEGYRKVILARGGAQ
jgi:acyl carrier protein/NAD(P)-dependent dehydrogenase (short-subunit alcohol dehydrogenase family)